MATSSNQPLLNLKWNNHTNNILQVFAEQFSGENLVDVTISCQGKFLKAHKMVLSACSPYFQELFHNHQVQHPVIIMNKMEFLHIKLIVEFMYKGEVKVPETDLGELLLVAETLQIKGLSNVRNKYELQGIEPVDKTTESINNQNINPVSQSSLNSVMHTEGTDSVTEESQRIQESGRTCLSVSSNSSEHIYDDDFPTTIKVEPPDIRDIDEEPNVTWSSPKLIIDMKEPKEKSLTAETADRNKPIILRNTSASLRVASAHLELSDEEKEKTESSENSGKVTLSTKCFVWPKRSLGRPKLCKIPRPPNAFMIFANDWRRRLALEFPGEGNKDISVRLGNMWKNLDTDSKEAYYSAARAADEAHKIKYPGYYYSPKEARLRKGLKLRKLLPNNTQNAIDAFRFVKVFMTNADKTISKEPPPLVHQSHPTIIPDTSQSMETGDVQSGSEGWSSQELSERSVSYGDTPRSSTQVASIVISKNSVEQYQK